MADPTQDPLALVLAFLAIGAASVIKGAIGFGLPLVAVPVVSSILDPRTAVVALSVPILVSNLMIVARGGGSRAEVLRLIPVLVSLALGTVLGAQLLARLDLSLLSILVGLAALAFVGLHLAHVDLTMSASRERYVSPLVGLLSGVIGGATNIFGLLMTAYLHTLNLPRRVFVFTVTLLFSVGGVTQVLSYLQLGLYSGPIMLYAGLALIPMVLGTVAGIKLQDMLPAKVWNVGVLVFISLSGLNLVVRGLWPW